MNEMHTQFAKATRLLAVQVIFFDITHIPSILINIRTCFERLLKLSLKICRKRQVVLQKWGKINIKSMELHKKLTL